MSTIENRIHELGMKLPPLAPPLAAYVPAIQTGNLVFTAGQLPTIDGKLIAEGQVGEGAGSVSLEIAQQCAQQAALNALAAIKSVVGDLDRVERIVKVTGFVSCESSFTRHSLVVNGASELIGEIFGAAGLHARSAVGMSSLPFNAPVEIEMIVEVR
jgi:enamine deaminase RidA (YjgF/YER057c/UK114 family)